MSTIIGWARRDARGVLSRGAWLLPFAALGCTDFADGDDVLTSETLGEQAGASMGGSDNDWSCLSGVVGRDPTLVETDRDQPLTYSLRVLDNTGRAPAGLKMRACGGLDPTCMEPVTDQVFAGEDGNIELTLFRGFGGFLEATSDETVPIVFFLPAPLVEDSVGPLLSVVSEMALRALAQAGGFEIDPASGHMVVIVQDCAGARASGAVVRNEKGGALFYYLSGIPTTAPTMTTADGVGGFLNVSTGLVVARAQVAADAREIGARTLYVRAGWISVSVIAPPAALRSDR